MTSGWNRTLVHSLTVRSLSHLRRCQGQNSKIHKALLSNMMPYTKETLSSLTLCLPRVEQTLESAALGPPAQPASSCSGSRPHDRTPPELPRCCQLMDLYAVPKCNQVTSGTSGSYIRSKVGSSSSLQTVCYSTNDN